MVGFDLSMFTCRVLFSLYVSTWLSFLNFVFILVSLWVSCGYGSKHPATVRGVCVFIDVHASQ